MVKTQATDDTQVSTPVCTYRTPLHYGSLEFHFEDGYKLFISPGRMTGIVSRKEIDFLHVRLTHFMSHPRGEYGRKNLYGDKDVIINMPLVKRYVEAAKTFVDREEPKNRDERWSESRRLIKQALKFEPKSPATEATKAK